MGSLQRHKASGRKPASETKPPAPKESKLLCCDIPETQKSERIPHAMIDPLARKLVNVTKTWIRHAKEKTSNRSLRQERNMGKCMRQSKDGLIYEV